MDERIKHLLLQGREHYDNREFDKAEKVLTQVLKENRGFADVYNMLGVIYHDQGRFTQAQECFEQALDINPAYTEAALNLAVTYNDLGKYVDAKRVYGEAMARSRSQPRSLDFFARGKFFWSGLRPVDEQTGSACPCPGHLLIASGGTTGPVSLETGVGFLAN